jgi:hypothetical protein
VLQVAAPAALIGAGAHVKGLNVTVLSHRVILTQAARAEPAQVRTACGDCQDR